MGSTCSPLLMMSSPTTLPTRLLPPPIGRGPGLRRLRSIPIGSSIMTALSTLVAFVDDEQPYYTTNPTSAATDWTGAGATTAQIDTYWIQHHDGFVYSGRQLNASGLLGNQVHYSDAVDLSDLYTVAADDPHVLYAGIDGMQIHLSPHIGHWDHP